MAVAKEQLQNTQKQPIGRITGEKKAAHNEWLRLVTNMVFIDKNTAAAFTLCATQIIAANKEASQKLILPTKIKLLNFFA